MPFGAKLEDAGTGREFIWADPLDNKDAICEPWSQGVVSLLKMIEFYASEFFRQMAQINAFEVKALDEDRNTFARPEMLAALYAELSGLMTDASLHNLQSVGLQCQRILQRIQQQKVLPVKCGEIRDELRSLRTRYEDELAQHLFLHLTLKEADSYQNPEKGWQEVITRFSKVRYNIEESAKCFALTRYGAAVFHILQVAEYGVIQVGNLLAVSGDKPGWSCLKRLQELIAVPYPQRSTLAQQHSKLLENVLPLATAMKDAWRHKLDHVDNQIVWVDTDFSPHVAEEIIAATRGFMRKLSAELPR